MKILFLAPHPFFQNRGSPIADRLILKALSDHGDQADVVTYHEGEDFELDRTKIYRIPSLPWIRRIGPGFSWKKIVCDSFLFFKGLGRMIVKRYDVIHAVEESVFIAMIYKFFFRVPYVYDMDSSLVEQLLLSRSAFRPLKGFFSFLEKKAIQGAAGVVAVCDSLAELALRCGARKIITLRDISLIGGPFTLRATRRSLVGGSREDCSRQVSRQARDPERSRGTRTISSPAYLRGTSSNNKPPESLLLYAGNLEPYQGIDLMLDAFQLALDHGAQAALVIVGGSPEHIRHYEEKIRRLAIADRVYFLGSKPPESLPFYFPEADILISPRLGGTNTPMKIYSYLHSGKPVLATDILSHTQVLHPGVALLKPPTPHDLADGMTQLIQDPELCQRLGEAGRRLAEEKFTFRVFEKHVGNFYEELKTDLAA